MTTADSTGAFVFYGVHPGSYTLSVGQLGLEPIAAVPLTVRGPEPIRLMIPVRAAEPLAECMRDARCAAVLVHPTSVELVDRSDAGLGALGFRLALALSYAAWGSTEMPVACVPPGVVKVLGEVYPDVAPESDCAPAARRGGQGGAGGWVRHTPTGRIAIRLKVSGMQRNAAGDATVYVSYYVANLWAAGFQCAARLANDRWAPRWCRLRIVS